VSVLRRIADSYGNGGGPEAFIRVYDGDGLPGGSLVERDAEKQISIDLRVDHAEADPNKPAGLGARRGP
jgi:hypothetical protein